MKRVHVPTAVTAPATSAVRGAARLVAKTRREDSRAPSSVFSVFFASPAELTRLEYDSNSQSSSHTSLAFAHARHSSDDTSTHSTAFVSGRTKSVAAGQADAASRRACSPARAAPEKLFFEKEASLRSLVDLAEDASAGACAQYAARAARAAARSTSSDAQNAKTRGARKITAGETKNAERSSAPSAPPPPTRDAASRSPAASPLASAVLSHPPAAPASVARATCATFLSKLSMNRQTRKAAPAARTCPATLRAGAPSSNSQARGEAATPRTSLAPISTVWWYSSGWTYAVPYTAQMRRTTRSAAYAASRAPTDQESSRVSFRDLDVRLDDLLDDLLDGLLELLVFPSEDMSRLLSSSRDSRDSASSSSSVSASRFARSTPPYTTRLKTVRRATALASALFGSYGRE